MTAIEKAPVDSSTPVGLEDMDTTDLVLPRLRINHDETVFEDNLSGAQYENIEVILLGLMKQRVLWPAEPGESGDRPMCKSFDFHAGIPGENFPTKASGFSADEVAEGQLDCASCPLKDWGSHPNRDTPWCSEQYTFAALLPMDDDDPTGAPVLLTVQRSAIKPSKQYLSAFARSKQPLYTVWTKISLTGNRRGTVSYAVPKFVRSEATSEDLWPEFAEQYRNIRDFVQTPPAPKGEDEDETEVEEAPKPKKVKKAPVAEVPDDDDDNDIEDAEVVEDEAEEVEEVEAAGDDGEDDDDLPF